MCSTPSDLVIMTEVILDSKSAYFTKGEPKSICATYLLHETCLLYLLSADISQKLG